MNRRIPLLLAALLGGAAQAADCTPPEGFTPATSPVPLQDISKNESKHRVTLLNIWAVWCAPCRKELPLLDAIAQDPGAPLDIITINLGDDPEQIGKNVGDDLAEGKPTLPLIYLMNQGSQEVAADVRAALQNADRSYFEKIHAHVAASDALSYCIAQAKAAAGKAAACLDVLPDNEATRAMRQLAEVSVARVM